MFVASNIPVLMYHHISPSSGCLTTSPENFERQMAWLARSGWNTLGADEFSHYLKHGKAPRKSILLTFDDGYLDNWVYAHPVLERHGLSHAMAARCAQAPPRWPKKCVTRRSADHAKPQGM
jgi:peptidoglycan/xylan/chitin deacetylase (PgdA/CDA1 family)